MFAVCYVKDVCGLYPITPPLEGESAWERGRPARILFLPRRPPAPVPQGYRRFRAASSVRRLAAAELQCDSAGSHLVGGHRISQAEGE